MQYMHVLGLWFANTATVKIVKDRLVDCFHHVPIPSWPMKYVTFYPWAKLVDIHIFPPVMYQYSCFFVQIVLLRSAWQQGCLSTKHLDNN